MLTDLWMHICITAPTHTYAITTHTRTRTGSFSSKQMCWYLNNLWPADTVAISPHKWPPGTTPCLPALCISKVKQSKWPNNESVPFPFLLLPSQKQKPIREACKFMLACCARTSSPNWTELPERFGSTHPYSRIAMAPVASRAADGASASVWPTCCALCWFSRSPAHSARTRSSHPVPAAWRCSAFSI